MNKRISPNYDLRDVAYSYAAQRLGIDNTPSDAVIKNASALAQKLLEPLRQQFEFIYIHSWYRAPALERDLCKQAFYKWTVENRRHFADANSWRDYLETKQHPLGQAVDIRAKNGSIQELYDYIKRNMDFDILKTEFHTEVEESGWVHVSYVEGKNRRHFE
jgi:hypothetical protein